MICLRCGTEIPPALSQCPRCKASCPAWIEGETLEHIEATPAFGDPRQNVAPPVSPPASGPRDSRGHSSPRLLPGSQFGWRYRIEALLGEGGMGMVYKAHDKELDRVVALKLLRPELTADPRALQRFKQELLLARKVSHKNILRIHDLGDAEGVKFISMDYVEGDDLSRLLKREGRLPLPRALAIVRQLCGALEAAHAEGIVHRDLKPQNVLIDASDQVYVSDFGLAKSLEGDAGMTRTGEIFGSPRYMSPEQVEAKPLDHRSDLYALGLIVYEMVTGATPFTGNSAIALMFQRVKERPKDPRTFNPQLPDYVRRVVMRCLEKDPEARYSSAREILADLEAQQASPPARPRRVSLALTMPGRRAWIFAGMGLALALAAFFFPGTRNLILRRPAAPAQAGSAPVVGPKHLAVLPFRVLGDQASLQHIATGMAEALSAKLFQLKELTVASSAAVEGVDRGQPLEKVARDLGVNLIAAGTVQSVGERIRVIVHLEDPVAKRRLWSREFSGAPGDLLALENQIFGGLLDALGVAPSGEERSRRASRPTDDVQAYELYLKGRNAMHGQQDVRNVEAAIRFYQEALTKDPRFALAYTGIADSSLQMYRETKDSLWADKALFAAQQAQRLDDTLAEVHFALGNVYQARGKVAEAIAELKRGLELSPRSEEGYRRLGGAYLRVGQAEEAIRAYRSAIDVNPYYWVNHNALGAAYLTMGEYQKAAQANLKVIELEPENVNGYNDLGAAYLQLGKYDEAAEVFQRALKLLPNPETYTNLGIAYSYGGSFSEAVPMFEKAVELRPNAELFVGNLADGYRWAGQNQKAAEAYDRAIALAYKELQVNPRSAVTKTNLALYYAKKGEDGPARKLIAEARKIDPANVNLIYSEATVHVLGDRLPEAFKALREALKAGYPLSMADADPDLKRLREDPRYGRLKTELLAKPA